MTDRTHDDVTSLASRRTVLRGAMVAGVAGPVLAACGGESTPDESSTSTPRGDGSTANGGAIASTADVPEGGGLILEDPEIVITQPAAGEFKGFSSICKHAGCPVDNVSDGTINCVCHGSQYSIEDGSPVTGPNGQGPESISALDEMPVTVQGEEILLA